MAQKKLAEALTRAVLILSGVLASSNQVANRLMRRRRNPDSRQIARPIAASQFCGIPAVGLDAVTGFHRHKRGRHDLTRHTECRQLPIENVAGRTCLVADSQVLCGSEFLNHFAHRFQPVRDRANGANLSVRLRNCNSNGVRVDIETHKSYFRHGDHLLPYAALRRRFLLRSVIRDTAVRGWSPHID